MIAYIHFVKPMELNKQIFVKEVFSRNQLALMKFFKEKFPHLTRKQTVIQRLETKAPELFKQ